MSCARCLHDAPSTLVLRSPFLIHLIRDITWETRLTNYYSVLIVRVYSNVVAISATSTTQGPKLRKKEEKGRKSLPTRCYLYRCIVLGLGKDIKAGRSVSNLQVESSPRPIQGQYKACYFSNFSGGRRAMVGVAFLKPQRVLASCLHMLQRSSYLAAPLSTPHPPPLTLTANLRLLSTYLPRHY